MLARHCISQHLGAPAPSQGCDVIEFVEAALNKGGIALGQHTTWGVEVTEQRFERRR